MRGWLSARRIFRVENSTRTRTASNLTKPQIHLSSTSRMEESDRWTSLSLKDMPFFCWGCPGGSAGKESACSVGDLGSIPGLKRSPGEGKGYPLRYSRLENCMDCIVYGLTKSTTWPINFHFIGAGTEKMGFPGGTSGKEPGCQCRRHKRCRFNPWVGKSPQRRAWQSIPICYACLENQWTEEPGGLQPWRHNELIRLQWLNMHLAQKECYRNGGRE